MRVLSLITLILLVGLFSCKKHRLKNEKIVLVGSWEWSYSIKTTHMTSPPFTSWTDTLFPSDVSSSYGVTFLEKGKVQLFENNELKQEYRIVFNKFENGAYCLITNNPYYFEIDLNNELDSDFSMNGCVNSDTLTLKYRNFPFQHTSSTTSSVIYTDFFKMVE